MRDAMKINVASGNLVKVEAVRETIPAYHLLRRAEVVPRQVNSGVREQPISLNETVQGAMNRARSTFDECDYSFGIESGFMDVPHTKTGSMNITVCAIYDGTKYHLGISSAFECPKKVAELVNHAGIDVDEAVFKAGLSGNRKIGSSEGIIGVLTKGRLNRKDYTKQAIVMALLHLENPELY